MKFGWIVFPVLALLGIVLYFQYEPQVDDSEDDWGGAEKPLVPQSVPPIKTSAKPIKKSRESVAEIVPQQAYEQPEAEPFVQELDQDAINSMAEARLHGDARAPAINPSAERVLPTPEELQDHDKYLQYEQRQEKKIYRAYVDAAKDKITMLEGMIKQGEEEGISEEELEQARKKIKGIEDMSRQLQQENPDIMSDEYKPVEQQSWINPPSGSN